MTRTEFDEWVSFYELHPFDDLHRIYRPAAMVSTAFGGGSIESRLEWLNPPPPMPGNFSEVDMSFLKAFGIKPPARAATTTTG